MGGGMGDEKFPIVLRILVNTNVIKKKLGKKNT